MKVKLNKNELQSIMAICSNIVDRKATMPILVNVVLSAKQSTFTISASDLEVTAIISIPAEVIKEGETTVNARMFFEVIKELPDGSLDLELTEGERIEIHSGGTNFKIIGASASEFPNLPGVGITANSSISATQFLDMISKTIYAVSTDETSFNMTGVHFSNHKDGKNLRMAATDGHRIAIVEREVSGVNVGDGAIVPRKGLSELKKYLSELNDAEIGIAFNDGFLIVNSNNAKFSIRLIDAEFPEYDHVIPKESTSVAVIDINKFGSAVRRASIFATDKMRGVKMCFDGDSLEIKSSSPELGEAREEMDIEYEGEKVEVGFNSVYVQDIVNSLCDFDKIKLELNGSLGPGKISNDNDPGYFSIIMPMRIG